jgi:hypothetical protein
MSTKKRAAAAGAAASVAAELRPINSLVANPRNARTHNEQQIEQIVASIREFGFTNPVLVDETGTILAGHGRVAAAKRLGIAAVPVVRIENLSDAQKRAYVIADNRLAEKAGWDQDILAIELQYLIEVDFNIELTGFATAEIDIMLDAARSDPDDEVAAPETAEPPVSQVGDLWLMGSHRLLCGDATRAEVYTALMAEEKAQMMFTDPPYNVAIDGHVCGSGRIRHREFVMASGEMTESEFVAFLGRFMTNAVAHSLDGSIHYVCMDWRHIGEMLAAATPLYGSPKNLCVWVKDNGGLGSFYRSRHELVFVFKNGAGPHINNFGLGEKGRYRTNIWEYAGVNSMKAGRLEELAMHPTVKPTAMVADAIRDCSKRKSIILDPFAGSGTTIIAAERTGRVARALELDPYYVDVAVRRWERATGGSAQHAETGLTFAQHAANRRAA